MSEVILNKVDCDSMACSLEVRIPFLDHELVEFVYSLPENQYNQDGVNKYLLREMLKSRLPNSILNKPKTGFGAPVNRTDKMLEVCKTTLNEGKLIES